MDRYHRVGLGLVVLALGALGCERPDPRIQQALQNNFGASPSLAGMLCGYPVRGFTNVSVSQVRYDHGNQAGAGTAVISGTPIAFARVGASDRCGGTVSFDYSFPARTARGVNNSGRYNQAEEHVAVTNYAIVRRDSQGPR